MLTIRPAQIKVFSQTEVAKFEEWMIVHLKKYFPVQCRAAGEQQLRTIIRTGIDRATVYEISSQRDVCKYIDLMVVLGRDFDTDRRFPWAAEILAKRCDSTSKMSALFELAPKVFRRF